MEGKTLVGGQKAWCGSLPVQDAGSDFFAIGSAPSLTANEIIVVSNSGRGSPIEIYRAAWEKWSPSVKRVKPQAASHCGGAISLGTMRRRGAPSNIYPIELFRDWELSVMRLARDESLLGIVIFSEIGYLVTLSAERVNVTLNCKENENGDEKSVFRFFRDCLSNNHLCANRIGQFVELSRGCNENRKEYLFGSLRKNRSLTRIWSIFSRETTVLTFLFV